jgi:hypothetical protein
MAVTKAAVILFVNEVLRESYSGTQLDEAVKACLADLSKANLLTAQDVEVLSIGSKSFALPADFKQEVSIVPSLSGIDYTPLIPFPGGYKAYKSAMATYEEASSTPAGLPSHYVIYKKYMFIWPGAGSAYTITTEYYKHHAKTADSIEFSDDFTNAINFGSAYFAALFRKKTSYVQIWRSIYMEEKAAMVALTPEEPHIVRG